MAGGLAEDDLEALRRHGRPVGSPAFLEALEARLGRPLRPCKPGPKPQTAAKSRGR